MSGKSAIEWTDATWNPITGCTKVGAGCDNCYAERLAERFRGVPGHPFEAGFDLTIRPDRLDWPANWRKPRRIFVCSMSDLFHKHIPVRYIDQVFAVMENTPRHTYQVLTKRSSRLRDYVNARYGPDGAPKHIWLGVSVEDAGKKSRIDHLRATAAAVRFLSLEPLLGPMGALNLDGIHWVIVGGESGPRFRPVRGDWIVNIARQCQVQPTAFFFKQWGGTRPKQNGRTLQGRTWDEYPTSEAPA